MKDITYYSKQFVKQLFATGELVIDETVNNIRTGIENFEPPDTRMYKSEFSDPEELLSVHNTGFCIDGIRCASRLRSYEGLLLIGATGTGKTSIQIINSVLRMTQSSMVINDPAGEVFEKTSGELARQGYNIFKLSFGAEESHQFNPLYYVEGESDVNKICSILVRQVLGNSQDPFWNLQAQTVLSAAIRLVLRFEKQYHTFRNVRHVLKIMARNTSQPDKPTPADKLFLKKADAVLWADYLMIKSMEAKLRSSVMATALAATSLWQDPGVCDITDANSFDFANLSKEKTCIYINQKTADSRYYSSLIAMFFELFFKVQMSRLKEPEELDCFVILEEASSLFIPLLPLALCNLRKFRCGVFHTWQSFESIVHAYQQENAEVIRTNSSTKVYLAGGASLKASEELERLLGRVEVKHNGKEIVRPLMFAEDIRAMSRQKAIVLSGNKNYIVPLVPYYKQPYMKLKTQLPPAQLQYEPNSHISLIPIPNEKD